LLVGRGYRTNDDGIQALQVALPEVQVVAFDLPHQRGPEAVLHLLSRLSPLDDNLVVAYLPLLPVRLVQLLAELEIRIVEVPDDEFETMGRTCSRWRLASRWLSKGTSRRGSDSNGRAWT
jgi:dimethylargininase